MKTRKDEGGLGFKDLQIFNKAMLGKQAWRLSQNPLALWSRVFKGIYFPDGDSWKAKKGYRPSWGWQSILVGRETIEPDVKWLVGDGKSIKIREDKWLTSGLIGGSTNTDDLYKVADLINGGTMEWKELTLQNMFAKDVIKEILAIPINHYPTADVLCWIANKTRDYTVRSRYNNQHSKSNKPDPSKATSSYQPPRQLWTKIWNLRVPPKVRIFLWSICQDALPTREKDKK